MMDSIGKPGIAAEGVVVTVEVVVVVSLVVTVVDVTVTVPVTDVVATVEVAVPLTVVSEVAVDVIVVAVRTMSGPYRRIIPSVPSSVGANSSRPNPPTAQPSNGATR
jgi:hypothetical protein